MGDDPTPLSEDFVRILHETETRVRHSAHAHWTAGNRFDTLNGVTTLSTLIGGSLISLIAALPVMFRAVYEPHANAINVTLFILGGVVSVLSILQAVQRWGERSQSHLNAANAFSSLRRKLEILRLNLPASAPDLTELLEQLRALGETAPAVPEGLWNKAIRRLK